MIPTPGGEPNEAGEILLNVNLGLAERLPGLLEEVRNNVRPILHSLDGLASGYVVNLERVLEIVDEIAAGFSIEVAE